MAISVPFLASSAVRLSMSTAIPSAKTLATRFAAGCRVSSWMILKTFSSGSPDASCDFHPVIASATELRKVILPSALVVITASPMLESATRNHSRCRASSVVFRSKASLVCRSSRSARSRAERILWAFCKVTDRSSFSSCSSISINGFPLFPRQGRWRLRAHESLPVNNRASTCRDLRRSTQQVVRSNGKTIRIFPAVVYEGRPDRLPLKTPSRQPSRG